LITRFVRTVVVPTSSEGGVLTAAANGAAAAVNAGLLRAEALKPGNGCFVIGIYLFLNYSITNHPELSSFSMKEFKLFSSKMPLSVCGAGGPGSGIVLGERFALYAVPGPGGVNLLYG
jgi:hypothetical protein